MHVLFDTPATAQKQCRLQVPMPSVYADCRSPLAGVLQRHSPRSVNTGAWVMEGLPTSCSTNQPPSGYPHMVVSTYISSPFLRRASTLLRWLSTTPHPSMSGVWVSRPCAAYIRPACPSVSPADSFGMSKHVETYLRMYSTVAPDRGLARHLERCAAADKHLREMHTVQELEGAQGRAGAAAGWGGPGSSGGEGGGGCGWVLSLVHCSLSLCQ
jgi:hypothetical protein